MFRRIKDWILFRKYQLLIEVFINDLRVISKLIKVLDLSNFDKKAIISFESKDTCEIYITNLQNFNKTLIYKYNEGKTYHFNDECVFIEEKIDP